MKTRLFSTFLVLILFSIVLLSNTFAQDYTQWELPEGAIARLGKGGISDIQYSPDGRVFAVATAIGIWLYDTATSQAAVLFTGGMDGVSCMAFSPDGRTFAVGSGQILQLWDTIIGDHQATLAGHTNGIFDIVFSSDGQIIATGSSDGTIRFWDAHTGEQKKTFAKGVNWITRVALSPDGKVVAGGSSDGTLNICTTTGEHKKTLETINAVAFRWTDPRKWQ